MLKNQSGFSLVELLVFVTILSMFFIMAASVVTVSLRNMKFNENKLRATHYASQLEEWLRTEKEIDWGGLVCGNCTDPISFTEKVTQQGTTAFCFNNTVIENWGDPGQCADYTLESLFKREVTFAVVSNASGYISQVNAAITISWLDIGNNVRSVNTNTLFSVLEQ